MHFSNSPDLRSSRGHCGAQQGSWEAGPAPQQGWARPRGGDGLGCSPLQMKHWMWKYLFCTRSASPLHTFPQVLHRIAVLGGFSGGLGAACGSDTAGDKEQHQKVGWARHR